MQRTKVFATAGLLCGIALSSLFDRAVNRRVKEWDGRWVNRTNTVGHLYQSPLAVLGTGGSVSAYGVLTGRAKAQRVGREIMESYAMAFLGSELVKHLVGRSRPYLNRGPFHFNGPALHIRNTSFPSGDVVAAFSMSTVLAAEIGSVSAAAVLYGLAALTAFQRISTNQHWLSDTVAGAVWGTTVGLAVVNHHQTRE